MLGMIKYSKSVLFEGQTHICEKRKKKILLWLANTITGSSCHKYHFCCDKTFVETNTSLSQQIFVMTKKLLLQQNYVCHSKHTFVMTKDMFCHDKHIFTATKLLSRQKLYLLQLLPMIHHTGFYQIKNRTFYFGI